jgi:heme O synthase-like polyprenyltransferase
MTTFLQFVAVTVLGLISAWIVRQYFGAVGQNWTTTAIGFAALLGYAFIFDRWQKRSRHRDTPGSRERD